MKTRKMRGIGIRPKILIPASIIVILLCVVMGLNSYLRFKEAMIEMGVEEAQMAAVISTKVIDADQVAQMSADQVGSAEYNAIREAMLGIKEDCGIHYLYTLFTDGSTVYYGIDADNTENANDFGAPFEESYEELKPVFDGEMYVQDFIDYTDAGDLITAYVPFVGSDGTVVGAVACDYDASKVVERLNQYWQRTIQISLICLVVGLLVINVVVGKVIRGLHKVDDKIYELVHNEGDLTQTLDVHTGDEMEVIAKNVNELLRYIRGIMLNISDNSKHLQESSDQVSKNLSSAQSQIGNVSSTMEEMSAAMEESSASLVQINEDVGQVFESIESIHEQAESESASADEIMKTAVQVYKRAGDEKQNAMNQVSEIAASVQKKIEKSREVEEIDDKIRELLEDMVETMHKYNGVGLAAVQVGILKRIIVIDLYDEKGPIKLVNPVIVKEKGEQEDGSHE